MLKLKKYDASSQGSHKAAATITFGRKGLITLSPLALQQTGFKPGDKVSLFQDEKEPADWYIAKDKDGLELREYKDAAAVNASAIVNDIWDSLEHIEMDGRSSLRFPITDAEQVVEKQKLFSIITLKPLNQLRKAPKGK